MQGDQVRDAVAFYPHKNKYRLSCQNLGRKLITAQPGSVRGDLGRPAKMQRTGRGGTSGQRKGKEWERWGKRNGRPLKLKTTQ